MKKPIKTYEIKYPANKQKKDYYANCEFLNMYICAYGNDSQRRPDISWW